MASYAPKPSPPRMGQPVPGGVKPPPRGMGQPVPGRVAHFSGPGRSTSRGGGLGGGTMAPPGGEMRPGVMPTRNPYRNPNAVNPTLLAQIARRRLGG